MIKSSIKVLTIISLVFVFFLFVFSMQDSIGYNNYITGMYVSDDVCEVFFTGKGSFYCEFGDLVCERLLQERCFGV
jgi:hypothetical protein